MSVIGPWYPPGTDDNGVLSDVFDEPNNQLISTIVVIRPANLPDIANYENFVWSNVYDPTTHSIRVIEV